MGGIGRISEGRILSEDTQTDMSAVAVPGGNACDTGGNVVVCVGCCCCMSREDCISCLVIGGVMCVIS